MNTIQQEHPNYITVKSGTDGFFAVLMVWFDDINNYAVQQTGMESHRNWVDAVTEATQWATEEGIRYGGPTEGKEEFPI